MCRILRVWKLKTSINTSHLLGFGNGRLWEAKSIVFYVSGRLWEAQSVVFYGSGSSKPRKIQDICPVWGEVGSTGAAVWRDLTCLVFSKGNRLFAERWGSL